jgi:hypothetical protein
MLRLRKSVAVLGIAIAVFAALAPAVAALVVAILTPLWVVIPAIIAIVVRRRASRCDEQPVPLLSLVRSRAPPSASVLA